MREVWQALDSERAQFDVERMQFGRTRQERYYITFYYVSENDEIVIKNPVQTLLDLRESGQLNMLPPLERLALAQDLTISTSLEDFGDVSKHVLSLQKLFESERDGLDRLRGSFFFTFVQNVQTRSLDSIYIQDMRVKC